MPSVFISLVQRSAPCFPNQVRACLVAFKEELLEHKRWVWFVEGYWHGLVLDFPTAPARLSGA
eukprot:scaffold31848_cov15-Tisochrysis_lutea.AAC.1